MTDYTRTTNFTAKDSLPSGDSGKVIKGVDHQTEYDNIATAVNSKANSASPTLTGTVTISGDITSSGTNILSGANTFTSTTTFKSGIAADTYVLIDSYSTSYNSNVAWYINGANKWITHVAAVNSTFGVYDVSTSNNVLTFTQGGGLMVGASPTGGDKGVGTINVASGVYDNGVRIGPQLFDSGAISAGTSLVELANVIDTTKYIHYVIELLYLVPTAQGQLQGQASSGGVYDTAARYNFVMTDLATTPATSATGGEGTTVFAFTSDTTSAPAAGNAQGVNGIIDLFVAPSANGCTCEFKTVYTDGTHQHHTSGLSTYPYTASVDKIKLFFTGTTIASGRVVVWGRAI